MNHGLECEMVDIASLEELCDDGEVKLYAISGRSILEEIQGSEEDPRVQALLEKYQEIFHEPTEPPRSRLEDHRIELEPKARVPPMRGIGRLDEKRLQVLKNTIEKLLKKGYIQPSTSPFGANILFATKADKSL
jgi:hypothetical protein